MKNAYIVIGGSTAYAIGDFSSFFEELFEGLLQLFKLALSLADLNLTLYSLK